jgi:hypothetical protein
MVTLLLFDPGSVAAPGVGTTGATTPGTLGPPAPTVGAAGISG